MKKKQVLGAIFAIIFAIAFIVLIQVAMVKSGYVEYHWEAIIYIAIIVGSAIIGSVIVLLISLSKFKKLTSAYVNKQYDEVIKLRNCNRVLPKASKYKDAVNYTVAIAYLETDNNNKFLDYMNRIVHIDILNLKYTWMAIYSVLIDDFENFKYWQELLKNSTSTEYQDRGLRTLDCLYKHIKYEYVLEEEDKSLINNWHSNILNRLLNLSC